MEQIKPIKVALVCGYTSHKTRVHLRLKSNKGLYQLLLKLFRLPSRVGEFRDTTPWIESYIYAFGKRNNIKLHIIAPHIRLKGSVQEFEMDGVFYHYYSTEFSSFLRIVNSFRIWKYLQTNGKRIRKIIDSISPDIVVLSGSENPASSVSAFYTKGYPTFILQQVVYTDPQRKASGTYNKLIWDMERKIFHLHRYYGVYCLLHYHLLKQITSDSIIFDFGYPKRPKSDIPDVPKTIDFINFAYELSEGKGAHDSIKALAIVKKQHPEVTLNLSGGCAEKTMKELKQLVREYRLEQNVSFTPFFERREDMFLHMKSARFAVLPIKFASLSANVYQPMRHSLPVVTNVRPGTIKVNEASDSLLLAAIDNVEQLAEKMMLLMTDSALAERLANNAHNYLRERDSAKDTSAERLIRDFHAVIDNYHYNTPIPNDLLCNENSFQ